LSQIFWKSRGLLNFVIFSIQVFGTENRVSKETASYEDKIRRSSSKPDSIQRYAPSHAGSNTSRSSSFNIPTQAVRERQRLPTSADSIQRRFKPPASTPPATQPYKPYNYLLNNRKDQSQILSHAPINGLNSNPINRNAYQRPPSTNAPKPKSRDSTPRNPTNYTRDQNPIKNFTDPNTGRKKVLHGFHYGLQQV
jgi:hypothetical protein